MTRRRAAEASFPRPGRLKVVGVAIGALVLVTAGTLGLRAWTVAREAARLPALPGL
jgi:hypothetical protein